MTLACGGSELSAPQGPAEVNATHYDYSFDLATSSATVAITLKVTTPGNCFDLPVRAAGFDVATIDDVEALARVDAGLLTACGDGWDVGTEIILRTSGTVTEETDEDSQVGYSTTDDIEGNPFTYMVSWVGGCDRFGPCQSDPDRFATYRFRVAHAPGDTVLCSGQITAAAGETTCEFSSAGGPTYSTFGLMVSPSWVEVPLGTWGPAEVTLYDFPTANLAADIDPQVHSGFVDFMEQNFGPYPYGTELRLAAGPTFWNGFEHPGNISISERLNVITSLYADPLEHTINHEIAHMWAGDQTTLASTYDFVWKEAMAEYLTFVYTDTRDPATAQQSASAWKQFSSFAAFYPVPAEAPALLDYYGDVYGPGPLVLFRHLEAIFDRETVMAALRTLLGSPRALSIGDIQEALETTTGADLENYFQLWVYGEGTPARPQYSVTIEPQGDGTVATTVVQENDQDGLFGCAFMVRLLGADTGEELDVWFNLGVSGAKTTTVSSTPAFVVNAHTFDPMAHCLATEVSGSNAKTPGPTRYNPWVVAPAI